MDISPLVKSLLIAALLDVSVGMMLGYLVEGVWGVILLGLLNGFGFVILLGMGLFLGDTITLALMILGGGLAWYVVGAVLSRRQGAKVLALLWVGFVAVFLTGHLLNGWRGVLTLTVPVVAAYWLSFLKAAQRTLPTSTAWQQLQTVKSVLTFTLGRNYPYYYVQHGEIEERVPGDVSRSFIAGPGIVLSDPTSAVAIWNGYHVRDVSPPGLTFTGLMEVVREVFDLRPQVHADTLHTRTRDGIEIKVGFSVTCRLDAGAAQAALGQTFPYRREAAFKATHAQTVQAAEGEGEDSESLKLRWDELALLRGKQTLNDILMQYTFDDLCAPFDEERAPRSEINKKWRQALQEAVAPLGIQITGAGFGDLMPVDPVALTARIENWRVKWAKETLVALGKSEAEAMRLLDAARMEARTGLLKRVSEQFEGLEITPERLSANMIAMRFVGLVEEMLGDQAVQRTLPSEVMETLHYIRASVSTTPLEEEGAEDVEP